MMTEEKEKTRENGKTKSVFEKRVWGGGGKGKKGAERFSNCRKPFFCRTDNNTPLKKPELQGKRR